MVSQGCGATRKPFLALAVTPWHALGVDVHVALGGDGIDASASTIAVAPHGGFPPLSPDSFPLARDRGIRVVTVPERYRVWDHVRASFAVARLDGRTGAAPSDVLLPRAPADVLAEVTAVWTARRLANSRFLIMDEGIGSYLYQVVAKRGWFAERPALTDVRRRILHESWKVGARWVESRPCQTRYAFMLDPESRRLSLAPEVGPMYVKLLKERALPLPPHATAPAGAPSAVIVTEPHAATGLSAATEARLLCEHVGLLANRGYAVYVKPHPDQAVAEVRGFLRGLPSGIDATIIDPTVAVERLFASLGEQDVVVGVTSGSLLSARVLFGLSTFTAARRFLADPTVPASFHERVAEVRLLTDPVGIEDVDDVPKV